MLEQEVFDLIDNPETQEKISQEFKKYLYELFLNSQSVRYIEVPSDCHWDISSEYSDFHQWDDCWEQLDKINNVEELLQECNGQWIPTFESGHGKTWERYRDDADNKFMDIIAKHLNYDKFNEEEKDELMYNITTYNSLYQYTYYWEVDDMIEEYYNNKPDDREFVAELKDKFDKFFKENN